MIHIPSFSLQSTAPALRRRVAVGLAAAATLFSGATGCAIAPPVEAATAPQADRQRPAAARPDAQRRLGPVATCSRAEDGSLSGAPLAGFELASWAPPETGPLEALIAAGALAYRERDWSGARECFEAAHHHEPGSAHALYGLGLVAEAEGDRRGAIALFERATRADADLTEAWVALRVAELREAAELLRRGDGVGPDGSVAAADPIARYREAIALAPHLPSPYLKLAELLHRSNDVAGAVEVLEQAHRHLGDAPVVLEQLAAMNLNADNPTRAAEVAERLVQVEPDRPGAAQLLADARTLYERENVPDHFLGIEDRHRVSREEIAALLALRVPLVSDLPLPERFPIVVDIDDTWAAPHIRRITATRLMEIFPNHTFEPRLAVTRGMLAGVVYRVLQAAGMAESAAAGGPQIRDLSSRHPTYGAARAAAALGILPLESGGRFSVTGKISGKEAVAAVTRLAQVLGNRTAITSQSR